MSRWSIYGLAVLASMAGLAFAQQASFHGPVTGFIYDRAARSVLPLLGIPGAAYLGPPVLKGVDSASVAPGGRWAFITNAGRSVFVRDFSGPAPFEQAADGLIEAIDSVMWSQDGSGALLYSSSQSRLQRVRFPDDAPVPDPPVDISSRGRPAALAIDQAGRRFAAGFAGQGLFLFEDGPSPTLLSSMAEPDAAVFDDAGRLYAIDAETQQLVAFDPGGGQYLLAALAGPDDSAVNAVALSISAGGRYLLLADSAAPALRVYETATGKPAGTIPVNSVPSRLQPISAGPAFLLNGENGDEPLLILDASRTPAVYFVPVRQQEATR